MKMWRKLIISKNILNVKIRYYIIVFILLLMLSVVPFSIDYIRNFNYDYVITESNYEQLNYELIASQLIDCNVSNFALNCDKEFSVSSNEYNFEYVATELKYTIPELKQGFTFYRNCVIFNNPNNGLNYIFSYPEQIDFSDYFNHSELPLSQLIIAWFYNVTHLTNLIVIVGSIMWIMVVNRLLLFVGFIIFPLVTKFIPKFRTINLGVTFKVLVWSLLFVTIPYFLITALVGGMYIFNLVYIYALSLFVILNIIGLYTLNSQEKEERLDNMQYL